MNVSVEVGGGLSSTPNSLVIAYESSPGLRHRLGEFDPANAQLLFRQIGKAINHKCPCCRTQPQVWNDRDGRWQVTK